MSAWLAKAIATTVLVIAVMVVAAVILRTAWP